MGAMCFREGRSMDLYICDGVVITIHSIPFIFRIDRGYIQRKQTHSVIVHVKYTKHLTLNNEPFARRGSDLARDIGDAEIILGPMPR